MSSSSSSAAHVNHHIDLSSTKEDEDDYQIKHSTHSSNRSSNESQPAPLLTDTFTYYKSKINVLVSIYKKRIEFYNNYNIKSTSSKRDSSLSVQTNSLPQPPAPATAVQASYILDMADIAGSKIGKGVDKNDTKSYLTIYAYPRAKQTKSSTTSTKTPPLKSSNDLKRKRITIELACSKFNTYDENLTYINQWSRKLEFILKNKENFYNLLESSKQQDLDEQSYGPMATMTTSVIEKNLEKPFLIFVNPKSGAGKAKNIYFERVVPLLSESNTPDTLVITKHANYAREYVQNLNLEDYRGLVVVSGDGLLYEILNGLMDRVDWRQAIKTPIGQIPGGSGNALSCSICYLTDETYRSVSLEQFATIMTFNLIKSQPIPLDIVAVQLDDNKIVHSFLNVEWGIIADVDLESEKYRFLGSTRFLVGALKRILNLRIYRGRLSFLPSDNMKDYKTKDPSIKLIRNSEQPSPPPPPLSPLSQTDETDIETSSTQTRFKYLKPFNEPVPNDWITIEENFVLFLVTYLPLLSSDFLAAPESKFNDGLIHLMFIKEGISKTQLLQLLSDAETGVHINNSFIEYVTIKAFRLEPLPLKTSSNNHDGIIMVDGERVPYGKIQGEVMPSLANILANEKSS